MSIASAHLVSESDSFSPLSPLASSMSSLPKPSQTAAGCPAGQSQLGRALPRTVQSPLWPEGPGAGVGPELWRSHYFTEPSPSGCPKDAEHLTTGPLQLQACLPRSSPCPLFPPCYCFLVGSSPWSLESKPGKFQAQGGQPGVVRIWLEVCRVEQPSSGGTSRLSLNRCSSHPALKGPAWVQVLGLRIPARPLTGQRTAGTLTSSLCLSFFIYKMKTKTRPCVDYGDGRGDAEGYGRSSAEPGAKQAGLGRIHPSLPGQQCLHSILQRE